jgi:hypothetical protein
MSKLTSTLSSIPYVLTNVYAPCTSHGKLEFLNWFHNIDMLVHIDWLIAEDFNLIRCHIDRNKPVENIHNLVGFNSVISILRLEALKLFGNRFTWTNNIQSPLLERLD